MKTLWIATAVCVLSFASVSVHAKSVCDIHRLGYTKTQCDQCSNMTWSVSRVFPAGACVATTAPPPTTIGGTNRGTTPTVPVHAKSVCDIHHLGYTKAQCDECSNMRWSVSKVFPKGECVGTAAPPPITIGGAHPGTTPTPAASSCTLTNWGERRFLSPRRISAERVCASAYARRATTSRNRNSNARPAFPRRRSTRQPRT